jgi:hypothetical protein
MGPEPEALELLEGQGGPFDSALYRRLWIESLPRWRDVSYGARAPDGTQAAIALLADAEVADSVPGNYGGIVASRPLGPTETESFLRAALKSSGARSLVVKTVPVRPTDPTAHSGGQALGWTSVVHMAREESLPSRWAYKVRRAVRLARGASAGVVIGADPEAFIGLYEAASRNHLYRYPSTLLRGLTQEGLARCYDVRMGEDAVSSVFVMTSPNHWMAWLAAQNERGRLVQGNYLAVATMLEDAQQRGVRAVNLGISYEMPGVAHFKQRFDAVRVPVIVQQLITPGARLADWVRDRSRGVARAASSAIRRPFGGAGG